MSHSSKTEHGFLLIISGPAGVGKSTIANAVHAELDAEVSVSMTTRPQTAQDVAGEHYYFVDEPTFRSAIERGRLLEWAQVYGNLYGTPRQPVTDKLADGRIVILEIDQYGASQVKHHLPQSFAVFIEAPNEQVLLQRLQTRQREDEATIQRRFSRAQHEIAQARASGLYDAFIVNDDLDKAVCEMVFLVHEEVAHRRSSAMPD